jgi:hypothetical protein
MRIEWFPNSNGRSNREWRRAMSDQGEEPWKGECPMQASAQSVWFKFISPYEGVVPYMYLDTRQLVTVGVGNLIEPLNLALVLPFQFKVTNTLGITPGRLATHAEIEAEWKHLKNHPMAGVLAHYGHTRCRGETNLELSTASQQQLFWTKTSSTEMGLRQRFPSWDRWPADAQLGLLAMGWGLGTGPLGLGRFTKFNAACSKQDFDAAADESNISSWPADRNGASVRLFRNAARVVSNPKQYLVSALYYPNILVDTVMVKV